MSLKQGGRVGDSYGTCTYPNQSVVALRTTNNLSIDYIDNAQNFPHPSRTLTPY